MHDDRLQKFRDRALMASLITLIACILFSRFEIMMIAGIPVLVSMIITAKSADERGIWFTGGVGMLEIFAGLGFWKSLSDNPFSFALLPTIVHIVGACTMLTLPLFYQSGRHPRP